MKYYLKTSKDIFNLRTDIQFLMIPLPQLHVCGICTLSVQTALA